MKAIFPVILSLALLANNGQGQSYQVTDLGALVGTNSYAQGINNNGQVVGYWDGVDGAHAFLYDSGVVTDLGLLGNLGANNYALSINNSGQVVGFSVSTNGAVAFVYDRGTNKTLGTFGGLESYAFGINDNGQIVGDVATESGALAFLFNNGITTNLGTLGGTNSFAYGVNNDLQVAGASLLSDNLTTHAFLWQNSVMRDLNQYLPSSSGWELTEAHGINDNGNIAGWGVTNGQQHAFLYYSNGLAQDLGTLAGGTNSYALGLNNSNQVVGSSSYTSGAHATLWQNGTVNDLNSLNGTSGWDLREATGINDAGQIVGWGVTNGNKRAFLIQPIQSLKTSNLAKTKEVTMSEEGASTDNLVATPASGLFTNSVTVSLFDTQNYPMTYSLNESAYQNYPTNNMSSESGGLVDLTPVPAGVDCVASSIVEDITNGCMVSLSTSSTTGSTWNGFNFGMYVCNVWGSTSYPYGTILCVEGGNLVYHSPTAMAHPGDMLRIIRLNGNNMTLYYMNNNLLHEDSGGSTGSFYLSGWGSSIWMLSTNSSNTVGVTATIGVTATQGDTNGNVMLSAATSSSNSNWVYQIQASAPTVLYGTLQTNLAYNSSSGAYSTINSITGDGSISMVLSQVVESTAIGFTTNTNGNPSWSNFAYGLICECAWSSSIFPPGTLIIEEGTSYQKTFQAQANPGDVLTVTRQNGYVYYYINNTLLWSHSISYGSPLYGYSWGGSYAGAIALNVSSSPTFCVSPPSFGGQVYCALSTDGGQPTPTTNSGNVTGQTINMPPAGLVYYLRNIRSGTLPSQVVSVGTPITTSTNYPPITFVISNNLIGEIPSFEAATNIFVLQYPNGQTSYQVTNGAAWFPLNGIGEYMGIEVCPGVGESVPASYNLGDGPIALTSPLNNSIFSIGAPINLAAYVWDASGTISQVQFLDGTNSLGFATNNPYALVWTNAPGGSHALMAQATDNNGLTATSSVVNISVSKVGVTIASPAENSVFSPGSNVNLAANVVTSGDTVNVVNFFQGTNLVGSAATPPYTSTWSSSSNGVYFFTAQAVDASGISFTSAPVAVSVGNPISISITNPPAYAITFSGSNNLMASVLDMGGVVTQVQYYAGSTLLGGVTNPPFNLMLTTLTNGEYLIAAEAFDNNGFVATSSLPVFYALPNLVSWWRAESNCLDSVGTNNGALQGSAGYAPGKVGTAFSLDGTNGFISTSANIANPQIFTLECWFKTTTTKGGDLIGFGNSQTGTSSSGDRIIYMDNAGLLHFGVWNGGAVMANSTASYNDGQWHHVAATLSSPGTALYVDGVLIATNASALASNYSGWWRIGDNPLSGWPNPPTSSYLNGEIDEVSIYSRVLSAGEIQAIYQDGAFGKIPSLGVILTNPPNNVLIPVGSNVSIGAMVSDPAGTVTQVRFFNGSTNFAVLTNAPYTFVLTNPVAGIYQLTAVATDNLGIGATSSVVNVTVDSPPSIAIVNPINNSMFVAGANITLTAAATATAGPIASVSFFQGTNILGTVTNIPFNIVWTNVQVGNYSVTASATDSYGLSTTSTVVNVMVGTTSAIAVISPTNGSTFIGVSTNITLTATALDVSGTITQVQFFQGGGSLGIVTNAPYTLVWSNVTVGSYAVTAVALDDNGFTNISSAVSFTVNPISVVITNPVNNTFFTASPTNIVLDSTVGDIAGTITQVQYFQGGVYIGTATNAPYAFTWTNVSNGFYTFNAVAFDDNGYAATSSVVKILVTPLLATNTALLWLKADAITALSSNAPISTWPDSSGRSNNALHQSTGDGATGLDSGYDQRFAGGAFQWEQ